MLKGKPLKAVLQTIEHEEKTKHNNASWIERYMLGVSSPFRKKIAPEKFEERWGRYLNQANLPLNLEIHMYYQFVLGHMILCVLMAVLFAFITTGVMKAALCFMLIYLGVFPIIWVKEKANLRMAKIKKEMPSIIMIIAITMEAGSGLNQAIREITRIKSGEFVSELTLYLESLEMGYSRKEALNRMSEKLNIIEMTQFTTMLEESIDKGAEGLSLALKDLSGTIWDRRVEKAKVLASKASAKLFLPLLLLVFPAMLIFILSPAVFSIMKHFGG